MPDDVVKKIAKIKDYYELQVAIFLHNIGFNFLDSRFELKNNRNTNIGEIDLIFSFDRFLFLIEVSKLKTQVRQKKFTFFTQWEDEKYLKEIREKYNASNKKIVRIYFDFAKETYKEESESVMSFIEGHKFNNIAYKEDFDYFVNCNKKIGKWARNDFLDWLGIADQKKFKETDAIQYYIEGIPAFCFVERVDTLLQSCYISRRRRSKPDPGYQRTLNEKRITKIYNSIKNKEGLSFPNSILIYTPSLTNKILQPDECPKPVQIQFPTSYCSCRIIDGQHRLLGFARMSDSDLEKYFLTVIALPKLDKKKEFKTFIDINYTQQKMDNNLLLHLKSDFEWDYGTKEYYERIGVHVAEKLNGKIFKNRIFFGTADERRGDRLTLVTIVSALRGNNQIKDSVDETFQNVSDVFSYIGKYMHKHLKPDGYFGQNRGIRVLFRLFSLYQRNYSAKKINITKNDFFKDLSSILDKKMIDILNDYYGQGGANAAAKELINALRKINRIRYKEMQSDLKGI